jgi:hypothetical protein
MVAHGTKIKNLPKFSKFDKEETFFYAKKTDFKISKQGWKNILFFLSLRVENTITKQHRSTH